MLLQEGTYPAKGSYKSKFLPLLAKARKTFYKGWRPDTLADDTREAVITQADKLFSSSEPKSLRIHCVALRQGNH
jgi:hypothetical protein